MRYIIHIILISILMSGCNSSGQKEQDLQSQIDNLKETMYKPGLGDFMGSIQHHHNKLWFAGLNENWELASFEIHELEELFEDIMEIYPDRKETQVLSMIEPPLETVEAAIEEQNTEKFKAEFTILTNTCNSCHVTTGFDFIKIKIPDLPAFSNQDFTRK